MKTETTERPVKNDNKIQYTPEAKKQLVAREAKIQLFSEITTGDITIGQATKRMRKIVGLTQKEYAEKVLKIYPRVLMDIEKDRGNPTLETLEKVAKPFGLKIGFVKVNKGQ